ncbi:MAG: DEAD/DEAH box helicase [Reichenbachiella sp.]|uniref:DEAD/DEAH box helicase n=1 Tax=Reichenbachiella sp. TaxID=2184521 RepID=UPI003264BF7F
MSYNLLSEPIRRYIRNKRWESLRPIQAAAISKIISTDNNYILASRTASGKTEAAFLPILSKTDFNQEGVQILYISPLIALINDQFFRVEELCKNLEIKVTKWHGEAKKSLKTDLIKNPNGIVLITPESVEAMLVGAPYNALRLFSNLKYVVIDEIHSFLGVDRGLHMMSLLYRVQELNKNKITTIGLSATIGDDNYEEVKRITGDVSNTKVLLDRTAKETTAKIKFYDNKSKDLSLNLLKDLYKETCANKVLIFPNSRGRVEEVAVKLRKISDRVKGHKFYYAHHSSVDKQIRENVEHFAKNNQRFNFCISCTSTLELGIDIGTVDKIVQIDSTHSVASLVQRIGRSGRREGEKSIVNIYATNQWSFLQSLACWQLYKSGFLEPIKTAKVPYDILLHQMLSIVKQSSGCKRNVLVQKLKNNFAFESIELESINEILDELLSSDHLELVQHEIILGLEGENIVNSRDFYSVFKTEPNYNVHSSGKKIGDIPFSPQVIVGENILLAAKIWRIKDVDHKTAKIEVIPAQDGKKPKFFGGGGNIHPKVRIEMLRILKSDESYSELDEACNHVLEKMRHEFKGFHIVNYEHDRPLIFNEGKINIYSFTGTKVNKSIIFLARSSGFEIFMEDRSSFLEIHTTDLQTFIERINETYLNLDYHLESEIKENEALLGFSKWGQYLPLKYKCEIIKERFFDFESAISFVNSLNMVVCH